MVPSLAGGGGCHAQHFLEHPGARWWRRRGRLGQRCLQARAFIWRDGLIVSGPLLRDPQGVARAHNRVYKVETQAAAQAAYSGLKIRRCPGGCRDPCWMLEHEDEQDIASDLGKQGDGCVGAPGSGPGAAGAGQGVGDGPGESGRR